MSEVETVNGIGITRRVETAGYVTLCQRTYIDADGYPTVDDANARILLGIEGREYPVHRAQELGLLDADGEVRVKPEPVPEVVEEAVDLGSMKKAELLALAEERGVEVPKKATNKQLIAALEAGSQEVEQE